MQAVQSKIAVVKQDTKMEMGEWTLVLTCLQREHNSI